MKSIFNIVMIAGILLCGCSTSVSKEGETDKANASEKVSTTNHQVVETIMSRRSIRKYKPQPVEREKMEQIINCGINAPNGMNKQSWEVRVVDNAKNGADCYSKNGDAVTVPTWQS